MKCGVVYENSSRDACEASANRRLSGQHMDIVLARQRQLEAAADKEKKRFDKASKTLSMKLQLYPPTPLSECTSSSTAVVVFSRLERASALYELLQ